MEDELAGGVVESHVSRVSDISVLTESTKIIEESESGHLRKEGYGCVEVS
jgi:hypothetical protein